MLRNIDIAAIRTPKPRIIEKIQTNQGRFTTEVEPDRLTTGYTDLRGFFIVFSRYPTGTEKPGFLSSDQTKMVIF